MADDADEKQAKELHLPQQKRQNCISFAQDSSLHNCPPGSVSIRKITTLAPDTFIAFEVSPGKHQLGSATFGGDQIEREFKAGVAFLQSESRHLL
jgi:hypothetical protein